MSEEVEVGTVAELQSGVIRGAGHDAVGGRWRRALRGESAMPPPSRRSRRSVQSMKRVAWCAPGTAQIRRRDGSHDPRPAGCLRQVPGLDAGYRLSTKVIPLRRGKVTDRDGKLFVQ